MSLTKQRACRHGPMAYLANDLYIGQSLDLYGEYGEHECRTLLGFVEPGDVVIDAGANVGALTIPLAKRVGRTGRVHAFEPQRFVHQLLCANVALNQLTNVHAHHAALGGQAGTIEVPALDYGAAGNYGGLALDLGVPGEPVALVTIDSLKLARLALLKADVEGMEMAVLTGARETISRCRPVLYLEVDRAERNAALLRLLEEMAYDVTPHAPPLFNPENFASEARNVFGDIVSLNVIARPRERS